MLLPNLKRKSCLKLWRLEKAIDGGSCIWIEKDLSYHLHTEAMSYRTPPLSLDLFDHVTFLQAVPHWHSGDGIFMLRWKKKILIFAVYSGKNDHVFSLSLPAKTKKRVKKSIMCFLALSWLAMQNNASDPGILEDFSRKIKVKFSYFVFSFSEELIIYWIRLFSLVMLYLVKDILPVAEMLFD